MNLATQEIQKYRQELNIPIDPMLDPLQTGFIGVEITPLTTTLGNLEAKQTTLNPDFAALLLRWMVELNFHPGDRIALQLSGSFPALNVAVIIACETLGVQPLISSSLGASSFGANLPQFSYLDMENQLVKKGIIHHSSELVTGGGNNDRGDLMWNDSDSLLKRIVQRTGHSLLQPESLMEAIRAKWRFYNSEGNPKGFINIGGNHASLGNCQHSHRFTTGVVLKEKACQHPERGLLMVFFENKIPVIHILDIRSLAVRSGLPLLPEANQSAGSSDVYFTTGHPLWQKLLFTAVLLLSWGLLWKPQRILRSSSTT